MPAVAAFSRRVCYSRGVTTLVTGGTGFVGSAVVRRLLVAGHRVRALVREKTPRDNLAGLDVEIAVGDLTDPASLDRAIRGCDAVFHVAADYRLWAPDPAVMRRNNIDGTRNVMDAALAGGVRRVVYTSSIATLATRDDGPPTDEDTPVTVEDMVSEYKRTKFLAEEVVRERVTDAALPAVIVNPATPLGPRDIKPTPTGRMLSDAVHGRMPAYVDMGMNIVHVDDVADGHVRAFERGRIGERYVLGGENTTLRDILARVAALVGRRPPRFRAPRGLLFPIAYAAEVIARTTGWDPPLSVDAIRMSRLREHYTSDKAVRELGYAPRPGDDAIRDAVEWFRAR